MSTENKSEKAAKELVEKFIQKVPPGNFPKNAAKACALICVDEILKEIDDQPEYLQDWQIESIKAWKEIKQSIQKL